LGIYKKRVEQNEVDFLGILVHSCSPPWHRNRGEMAPIFPLRLCSDADRKNCITMTYLSEGSGDLDFFAGLNVSVLLRYLAMYAHGHTSNQSPASNLHRMMSNPM